MDSLALEKAQLEKSLAYPFAELPGPAETCTVAPGIRWIRLPLPFALDHVNVYLLEDQDGWTLVDTGLDRPPVRALWEEIFARQLDGRPIARIIATHHHPDHVGLAGWIAARFGAEILMTRTEWLETRALTLDTETATTIAGGAAPFYTRMGVPAELLEALKERKHNYREIVHRLQPSFRRLADGESVMIGGRSWQVLTGGGHSAEQACLWCGEAGVFLAADHVLPRITPNVSVWHQEPESDPLADYVHSLRKVRSVPDSALVLPGHGKPFLGLHVRLDQLERHHEQRLEETLEACHAPATVHAVSCALWPRELDVHQRSFAMGETLAHLNHLLATGALTRSSDSAGVLHFEAR